MKLALLVSLSIALSACKASTAREPQEPRPPSCQRGFTATFIQLKDAQLQHGREEWQPAFETFQLLGVDTVILQFSGDEHGPYEGRYPGSTPIRSFLELATELDIKVFLGLFADPSFPANFNEDALPPPLDNEDQLKALVGLCEEQRSCAGIYLPSEVEDYSFAHRPSSLRNWLERISSRLRPLIQHRPIALAPFYAGTLTPNEYAAFWSTLLETRPVDIVILQDGIGSGHGSLATIGPTLSAMRGALEEQRISLWSVLELFEQQSGPPHDDLPFSAKSAPFPRVKSAYLAQLPHVSVVVAFSVLDYMSPEKDREAASLFQRYLRFCL